MTATRVKTMMAARLKHLEFSSAFQFILSLVASATLVVSTASAIEKSPPSSHPKAKVENYKDLISKARHLTFQRDRLQTTQVLLRGIQRENKNSIAHKELVAALDELSGVFYTEKAQSLFLLADAMAVEKTKEAIDKLNEALRLEEGNLSIIKALGRAYLRVGECGNANKFIVSGVAINPYSTEIKLLNIQLLDCEKSYEKLSQLLSQKFDENDPVDRFTKGLRIRELQKKDDLKGARALLASWESAQPEYPEVYYWKWVLSGDRAAGQKYLALCQNLTPRKKKSFHLDLELCKSVEKVNAALRSSVAGEGELE